MESLQHTGRSNRFLLCFRPLPMAGSLKRDHSKQHSTDQVLAYIAVGDKDRGGVVVPAIISPLPDDNHKASAREFSTTRRRKRGFTRHLSRVVKAVLFETSLVKRIRSRKSRKSSFRSVSSSKSENFSNLTRDNSRAQESLQIQYRTDNRRKKSTSHTPRRSASTDHLSPPSMCANCWESAQSLKRASVQHNTAELNQSPASYTGLCLLLVSLFALVFWGKICAIFCASTWLFLVPRYNQGSWFPDHCESQDHCDSPDHCESPDVDSVKHTSKVVMGLPQRSRRRNTHTASF